MLLPRVLTAFAGIPVIFILVHLGGFPYAVFIGVVILLSLHEYALILRLGGKHLQIFPLYALGLLLAAASVFDRSPLHSASGDNFLPLVFTVTAITPLVWEIFSRRLSMERAALTLFGVFFISWNLVHFVHIRDLRPDGEALTYMLLVAVWIMDTAAYFAGRSWGRNRLAELVSPGKTWEGAVAGFVAAVVSVLFFRMLFLRDAMSLNAALASGAVIGTAGQLSDLAESVIKRCAGVKDSSNLLPGHGGILDRFDSYIFLAPLLYYFLVLAG
ncbi:MAG: phosphatidate cytidylyltransferase [bacterium]